MARHSSANSTQFTLQLFFKFIASAAEDATLKIGCRVESSQVLLHSQVESHKHPQIYILPLHAQSKIVALFNAEMFFHLNGEIAQIKLSTSIFTTKHYLRTQPKWRFGKGQ